MTPEQIADAVSVGVEAGVAKALVSKRSCDACLIYTDEQEKRDQHLSDHTFLANLKSQMDEAGKTLIRIVVLVALGGLAAGVIKLLGTKTGG